jgi:very-short-patch-repair endonuclease
MKMPRETRIALIRKAREMRKNPTKAEALLWTKLRKRQLDGYKFRRQQVIGRHIVDYYCSSVKVVVEVDGMIHLQQKVKDQLRDEYLGSLGYEVIRFRNDDVFDRIDAVLEAILSICSRCEVENLIQDQ